VAETNKQTKRVYKLQVLIFASSYRTKQCRTQLFVGQNFRHLDKFRHFCPVISSLLSSKTA